MLTLDITISVWTLGLVELAHVGVAIDVIRLGDFSSMASYQIRLAKALRMKDQCSFEIFSEIVKK